ncbi:ATP-binding cassette domain-containing protein [Stappia sp. GBMRC 2046]|uniref:ATP-binding cassette domain-containing protein n=1 Tax=Stappia sediminis TaxID=2692190 RepID=A0A7X3S9T1_9HYPH|nr:ABC transporter ATP-binding protein [Stappia sediminis]MXN67187.1 ATP-binding cassette domain-containing protein [Stappia sediminis]
MIRLEQVSKSFKFKGKTHHVVRDVSFTIPRGRSVGLIGRNGAGKSTLLRLIAGIAAPDRGQIIKTASVSWPLGFAGSFHTALTGEQNVRFVARIYGKDTEALVSYVEDFAELGQHFRRPVGSYSSGMKARLAFGVSMGIAFDYYLIDEVTAVGDTNFKKKCSMVFHERLKESDIVMVSHSAGTLRQFCNSGILLEDGKLTFYEDIEEALQIHQSNMAERTRI